METHKDTNEDEIQQAKLLYESNLASVQEALASDPTSAELLHIQDELKHALREISHLHTEINKNDADTHTNDDDIQQTLPSTTTRPRLATTPTSSILQKNKNAFIHPRNIYASEEPDFIQLAREYPSLQQYLRLKKKTTNPSLSTSSPSPSLCTTHNNNETNDSQSVLEHQGKVLFDFSNPNACRLLTKILLKKDFDIDWWIPDQHLIPPITNRLNYILWIEDLVRLSSPFSPSKTIASHEIRGLDIGCGANFIFPLLGSAVCGWTMVGVDVTPSALEWARKNKEINPRLDGLLEIRRVEMQRSQREYFYGSTVGSNSCPSFDGNKEHGEEEQGEEKQGEEEQGEEKQKEEQRGEYRVREGDGILTNALYKNTKITTQSQFEKPQINKIEGEGEDRFCFCMCNPPFFQSSNESNQNPKTNYSGTDIEMVYPCGGEESFVTSMVEDSLILRDRIHWYTTMVGKKTTLKAIRKLLYSRGVRVVRTTEFCQGKTSRWGIAWSLGADARVVQKPIERIDHGVKKRKMTNM